MDWPYHRLADTLTHRPDDVLATWLETYRRSPLRLPASMGDQELAHWFAPVLESLTETLAPAPRSDGRLGTPASSLRPGRDDTREVEKAAGFLGGRMAAEEVSGFDVAAVFTALRDTLGPLCDDSVRGEVGHFFEWLAVLAVDAMASARVQALRERTRDELENGTPVVLVAPDVVAAFLIGPPDPLALDTTMSRVMLRVARVGARAVIIDVSGVAGQDAAVLLDAIGHFLEHRKIAGRIPAFIAGVADDAHGAWGDVLGSGGATVSMVSTFEEALESALEHSEYRLIRRR